MDFLSSACGPGTWLREAKEPALDTQLVNGPWARRSDFKLLPLSLPPLSVIGSCHHSPMEFNFQKEGWGGWRLRPLTLIKCLGTPKPHPLPLPTTACQTWGRARRWRQTDFLARLALQGTEQHLKSLWHLISRRTMIRPRQSPHWNLLVQLPAGVFLTFPGVPVSRDGPQGGSSEGGRATLGLSGDVGTLTSGSPGWSPEVWAGRAAGTVP